MSDNRLNRYFRYATVPLGRKPDYMIIGAQKAGTTALFEKLSLHPDICNPPVKEMHHFDRAEPGSFFRYRSWFPIGLNCISGEATPSYFYHKKAAQHISKHLPRCKFIVILRDPALRAYSHYRMEVERGRETLPFEQALEMEQSRIEQAIANQPYNCPHHLNEAMRYSYYHRGLYADQLKRWQGFFSPHRIHIIEFTDLLSGDSVILNDLYAFLEIKKIHGDVLEPKPSSYPAMPTSVKSVLSDRYAPHNEELFSMIGRSYNWT